MHQINKSRKGKGHSVTENSTNMTSNKTNKLNELKNDHSVKQYDKSQPTAEQITIAQIIDTKAEDPTLKDKLKQVMDATQRSADEAYTALHDSDNDPNRAVNLLLEGGSKDEWSTSSKKKKVRVPTEKSKDAVPATDVPVIASRGSGGISNQERVTEPLISSRRGGKSVTSVIANGPTRGRGGMRARTSGRGGSFVGGRGGRAPFRKTIETWDGCVSNTNTTNQPDANHDHNCSGIEEDWDNEEFTGSLANSQVFTPSSGQIHENRSNLGEEDITSQNQLDIIESNSHIKTEPTQNQNRTHPLTPSRLISHFANMQIQQQIKGSPITPNCSVVIDGTLTSRELNQVNQALSKFNYLTAIRGNNRSSIQSSIVPPLTDSNSLTDIRIPRIAQQTSRVRPKIPPPSKIPLTAVEMPPDVGSSLGLLDVQFGALEFGETNSESVVNSPASPHRTPSPPTSDDLNPPVSLSHVWCQSGSTEALLSGNDRSFSPVRGSGTGTNSLPSQLVDDVGVTKIGETTTVSAFYPDSQLYQSSLYTKASPQTIYNSTYCSPQQVLTSNNTIYSTSSSQNTYSSSSIGTYGSSAYPNYQYSSYGSSHPPNVPSNSSNSYQSSMGMGTQNYGSGGSSSVYGNSGLGGTSSYSTPQYPTYNSSSQHNHKSLTSTANSKEFDSPAPSVNLNSISHSGTISVTPTLLSSTQTTSTTKPGSISTMGKGTAMTNLPPGVPSLVSAHQYAIVGQGGVPYIQQPPVYYEDFQLMQQQRLPPHIATGYYELGFQATTTRGEGMQFNMSSDGRFVRADNTSPVQLSSLSQQPITNLDTLASSVYGQRRAQASAVNQSGNQAGHQQPLLNPTAIPPAYAYFYGGSVIPGNFQFGAPTLYPVAAAGTTSGHNSTSGGHYSKGPSSYPTAGSYTTGIYDGGQGTGVGVGDYKAGNSGNVGNVSGVTGTTSGTPGGAGPKGHPSGAPPPAQSQQPPSNNPPTTSDISNIYTKSHSALSKVGSYDKQGFHCATPPPFNLSSQNSGMGPAPGYPQHLFIPTMTAHHNTTLMHQQIHQDGPSSVSGRSQVSNPQNKASKNNYSSTYWTQN